MEYSNLVSDSTSSSSRNRKRTAVVITVVIVVSLAVIAFCLSYFLTRITRPKDTQITIDGGKVAGYKVGDVSVFKGIPYAKPPVATQRWRPPEPCGKGDCWEGTFDATKFGEMCFQTDSTNVSIVKGKEDCLFVNVWSPNLNSKDKLPVLVYIHGGFLNYGSGDALGLYPNSEMVSELNIVGVSFNYRLNAFGFLSLDVLSKSSPTDTSGNYGFMDQILALKWTQVNIEKFGGDPNRVTILGQSSGGTSELALLTSPMAKGLFHGAIMMSASAVYNKSAADASRDNEIFVRNSKCQRADVNSTIKCLYNLSAKQVVEAIPWDVYPYWAMANLLDLPTKDLFDGAIAVVDGYVVPIPPLVAMATEPANDVPLVVGTTAQEIEFMQQKTFNAEETFDKYARKRLEPFLGVSKTTVALDMYRGPAQYRFVTMGSDIAVTCPDDIIALNASSGFQNPVYRYVVTNFPTKPVNILGTPCKYAFHMWDLIAFFGFPNATIKYKPSMNDLAFMRDLRRELGSFIRYGRVNNSDWYEYPNGTALFTDQGVHTLGNEGYRKKECSFWMENGFFSYAWIN